MRPNPLVVRTYVIRGIKVWIATRLALSAVFFFAAGLNPFGLSAGAVVGVIGLTVAMGYLETRFHREFVLLGNLGVSPLQLGVCFGAPALLGELMLGAVAAVIS
jgi:hypothetical protein